MAIDPVCGMKWTNPDGHRWLPAPIFAVRSRIISGC
jgi:hypothetical protein